MRIALSLVLATFGASSSAETFGFPFHPMADYEFLSVLSESSILVNQGGTLFQCTLTPESDFVELGNCVAVLTVEQRQAMLDATVAAVAAMAVENAARKAADDAYAKKVQSVSAISDDDFSSAIVRAANASHCVLKDATDWAENDEAISLVWTALDLGEELTDEYKTEMRRRMYRSVTKLVEGGVFEPSVRLSIKLKDCS